MSDIITSRSDVPEAAYYVLCNDSFLSGWGQSEDKINTCILRCQSWEEAQIVKRNAAARSEMTHIRVIDRLPQLLFSTHTYSVLDRVSADRWYTPGGFE